MLLGAVLFYPFIPSDVMVTLQSVRAVLVNSPHFNFSTFGHSGAYRTERQSARMSKNHKGGLDRYSSERFGRLIFATQKKCGTERIK